MDPYVPPPIRLQQGAAKVIPFRFYRKGSRTPLAIPSGSLVQLETSLRGVAQAPVVADEGHPDADWAHGLVPIQIDATNLTAVPGSYAAVVSATVLSVRQVCPESDSILIEVERRPSYVAPASP